MCALSVLDEGPASAERHMHIDRECVQTLSSLAAPFVRFYEWEASAITYGHFIDPWQYVQKEALDRYGVQYAKRPTGGGVLFHGTDFAFTVGVPAHHKAFSWNVLHTYHLINQAVVRAVSHLTDTAPTLYDARFATSQRPQFCLATATPYDIMLAGRKVGGAAQRKTRYGFLHQASLFIAPFDWQKIGGVLVHPDSWLSDMQQRSSIVALKEKSQQPFRNQLKEALTQELRRVLDG